MLEFTLADQVADLPPPPPVLTSSGQEWQFQVSYKQINWQIYPLNALWDIYYGMYLASILDSSRKGENFLLFLNNLSGKQSVNIVESCQM